jgi:hypothetical protein
MNDIANIVVSKNSTSSGVCNQKRICGTWINWTEPNGTELNTKENETLRKYKDLEIAVSRMSKVRTKIVSVIIGALGTIKKGLDQNL